MTIYAPENVYPELAHMWPHWNVGRLRKYRVEREVNSARLRPFVIDRDEAGFQRVRAAVNPKMQGRYVPEGRYVRLMVRQGHEDATTGEPTIGWQTVMSDTPDEMNDHADPLLHARGRVLIHGLGLGCVLNCIRNIPGVEKIDVVEVNEDVVNLVAPLHIEDKRVNIIADSCVDVRWPVGTHWDYVWHDIWSSIDSGNLTDDKEAEHHISYARLHRMFGHRCDRQASWGFELARRMRWIEQTAERYAQNWAHNFNISSLNVRTVMWHEVIAPPGVTGEQYVEMTKHLAFDDDKTTTYEHIRKQCRKKMTEEQAYWFVLDFARAEGLRRANHRRRRHVNSNNH